MKEREKTMHSILRQELRRHHFFGGGINISREDAPEFEKALARAEHELGLLDPEVAVKVYGFGEVVKDDLVEPSEPPRGIYISIAQSKENQQCPNTTYAKQ